MALPEFPKADFYDCRDSERLTHETPEEAVEEYLDCWAEPGDEILEEIKRISPLTVTAFVRSEVSDGLVERRVDWILEDTIEWFDSDSELADPDGDHDDGLGAAATEMRAEFIDLFGRFLRKAQVWSCEEVGSVTLTAEQVEEMMREHCPEWFEDADAEG